MFGKPEQKKQTLPDVKITKMPDDFYAGTNPIVKFKNVEKVIKQTQTVKSVLSSADKKLLDQKTSTGAGNKLHPINLFTNWKFLIVAGLGILIVGVAIISFYYWWQYRKTVTPEPIQPVVTEPVVTPPAEQEISPTSTVEPEPVATLPTVSTEVKLDFPSFLLGDSVDTDKDDITDVAEELFGTDPAIPDSDNDKFTDGHEVFYLYNPAGKEPMSLVGSGLVNVYANPVFLYKIYYPKSWAVGIVDVGNKDVLFSTLTGENIEVRAMDMNAGESFNDWFARNASGEQLADYLPFESVFKETGFARKDNLVYFFPKGNQVFAILYHTTDSNVVNYHMVIKMLARSFQFGSATEVPARTVEESATTTL
ncbi:MAG: hypothetical protein WCT11_02430 [Candidatus Magasanikbacteria bacterium]